MQVKAVAKKIVDLFGNNNVNATVVIDDPTIVCYAEDYDYAINTIKAITNVVYMTVNKNIVACAVDGITVAITAGKLHYSDQVISGFACAAMSRSEMHPEYMGERQLIVAVQKMIAERFNNIVGSSECVDDVIVCHVDKLHDAYLAIEDIAVDFVTVEPGRMIAGIVKGIVVGIEYVEPKTWPTDNYLIRSYANQAIAKHGGYPKYDKAIAENVDFVKTLSKSGLFEIEGGPTTNALAEHNATPMIKLPPINHAECIRNLEKLLEGNTDSAKVQLMNGYIACLTNNIENTYRAISSVAEHFVRALNEYIIVGFVDRSIVAIIDGNSYSPKISSGELKSVVMDAISKRGEYKKYVPVVHEQPSGNLSKEVPMSHIKQVKEMLVGAFYAANISSTVVYNDKCVVCYVADAEEALRAIKDLTDRIYFTADSTIFACQMDSVSVAIVVGVKGGNIENVYRYIKGVLRNSFQFTVPAACIDDGEQKSVAPVKVDFNAKFTEMKNKVISALSGKTVDWELRNVIIPLEKETEEIAMHRVLVIKTRHPSLVTTALAEAFAIEFSNYNELGTAFLGFVDGLPVRVYDSIALDTHKIDVVTVSAIHRCLCAGSMLFNCPDRSFLLDQGSDRYCADIRTSFAEYGIDTTVIHGRFETGEYDCMLGVDTDDVVKLEEILGITYSIKFEPMDACHSIGFFGTMIVVTSSRKRPGCNKKYKLRMDLYDMVRKYVKEKDMPVSANQEESTQMTSADSTDNHVKKHSAYIKELADNLMKEPAIKNFIDKLASLTPEERSEILTKKESVKQVEEYLNLKLTAVKVGFGTDERNGYLSCKVDAFTDLVKAGIIDSVEQLNDTKYQTIKYAPFNNVMVVFAENHPNDDGRYLDEDMYDAICQVGINFIVKSSPVREGPVSYLEKPVADGVKEKPMPKGQYNLFCNAHLTAVEPHQAMLNIFNHTVNVDTGDRLFKAIFKLIESYMRYFNMVSISSLYGQGFVTDPANIPKLYSMSPTGTLLWDRNAIISFPTCHEVTWHSSQYVGEVAKKHNESFLLNIIDKEGRQFKVAIHGAMSSYHGKPFYLMNIFEMLQDNQEPYAGDVYKYLMDYLNK